MDNLLKYNEHHDDRGRFASSDAERPMLHFVGFKDNPKDPKYLKAVKLWGEPDFKHKYWDERAAYGGERGQHDVFVFAEGTEHSTPSKHSYDDSAFKLLKFNEHHDDRGRFAAYSGAVSVPVDKRRLAHLKEHLKENPPRSREIVYSPTAYEHGRILASLYDKATALKMHASAEHVDNAEFSRGYDDAQAAGYTKLEKFNEHHDERGRFASADAKANFDKWFGNSKVVNSDGSPMVVYHSTLAPDFKSFGRMGADDIGYHFGTSGQAQDRMDMLSGRDRFSFGDYKPGRDMTGERMIPVYLKLENPIRLTDPGNEWSGEHVKDELHDLFPEDKSRINELTDPASLRTYLESKGYDGVVYRNVNEVHGAGPYRTELGNAIRAAEGIESKVAPDYQPRISALEAQIRAEPDRTAGDKLRVERDALRAQYNEALSSAGYDAAKQRWNAAAKARNDFLDNVFNYRDSYIAFHPTQIKSAISNSGAFNPKEPDFGKLLKFNPNHAASGSPEGGQFTSSQQGGGRNSRATKLKAYGGTKGFQHELAVNWIGGKYLDTSNPSWHELQNMARQLLHGTPPSSRDSTMVALALEMIHESKPLDYPLYRGITHTTADYKVGDKFSESLSSWTPKPEYAGRFASGQLQTYQRGPGTGGPEDRHVVFTMKGENMKALPVGRWLTPQDRHEVPALFSQTDEHLASGEYQVTKVTNTPHLRLVEVTRVGDARTETLARAETTDDLVKYNENHDEKGRFSAAQNAFMKEYVESTHPNPLGDNMRWKNTKRSDDPGGDFVGLEVRPSFGENDIHISAIQAMVPRRSQGQQGLDYLKSLADKHGVSLSGFAKKYGSDPNRMSTPQLKKWYAKNGFKVDRAGNMKRLPAEVSKVLLKYNPNHLPGGSPEGGEFTSGSGGGAVGEKSVMTALVARQLEADGGRLRKMVEERTSYSPEKLTQELSKGLPARLRMDMVKSTGGELTITWGIFQYNSPLRYGVVSRTFLPDHTVGHSLFELKEEYTGRGIAKAFLANSDRVYEHAGIDKIMTHAALDNGAYTWAKFGFLPAQTEWDRIRKQELGNRFRITGFSNPQEKSKVAVALASSDPHGLWTVADSEQGKRLLGPGSSVEWAGGLNRKDPVAMQRFRKYVSHAGARKSISGSGERMVSEPELMQMLIDEVEGDGSLVKFNPNHDDKGLFASSQGGKQTDSKAFKTWFGDSKVVNSDGSPKVVYHGTLGDFSRFDPMAGNTASHWGSGFYFTDSINDVNRNYAREGNDIGNRIKDATFFIRDEEKISLEAAGEKARALMGITHEGAAMPVYLKIEKPFKITAGDFGNTRLTSSEAKAFLAGVEAEAKKYEGGSTRGFAAHFVAQGFTRGIGFSNKLETLFRNNDGVMEFTDKYGKSVGHEIFKVGLQKAGFDGIIDQRVSSKWPGMKISPGSAHYTVFKPTQIKSAIGNRGTFSSRSPDITKVLIKAEEYYYDHRVKKTFKKLPTGFDWHKDQATVERYAKAVHAWLQATKQNLLAELRKRGALKKFNEHHDDHGRFASIAESLAQAQTDHISRQSRIEGALSRLPDGYQIKGRGKQVWTKFSIGKDAFWTDGGKKNLIGRELLETLGSNKIAVHVGDELVWGKLTKFNEHHDDHGRFAPADGRGSGGQPAHGMTKEEAAEFKQLKALSRTESSAVVRAKCAEWVRSAKTESSRNLRRNMIRAIRGAHGASINKSILRKSPEDPTEEEQAEWDRIAQQLSEALDLGEVQLIVKEAEEIGGYVAQEAATATLAQFGVSDASELFNTVSDTMVDWAADRAAELVGMRYNADGDLVESANAEMAIDESTREMIRTLISDGLEEGKTLDEIAQDLADQEDYPFSEDRAYLIASTEIANAASHGALDSATQAADELDLNTTKFWLVADTPCPICEENAAAGSIPLDEDFPSGDDAPTAHPNCRCAVAFNTDLPSDQQDQQDEEDQNPTGFEGEPINLVDKGEYYLDVLGQTLLTELKTPLVKYNENHDDKGKFSSAPGGPPDKSLYSGRYLHRQGLASTWIYGGPLAGDWSELQHAARWAINNPDDPKGYVCIDCKGDDAGRLRLASQAVDAINSSKPLSFPLYRGLREAEYKVGDTFSESLSSWTPVESYAKDFAGGKYGGSGGDKPAVLTVEGQKMHGLPIAKWLPGAGDHIKAADEYLTSGKYKVTSVKVVKGQQRITVTRIGNADGDNLVKGDLIKFNPHHDEQGRFASSDGAAETTDHRAKLEALVKAEAVKQGYDPAKVIVTEQAPSGHEQLGDKVGKVMARTFTEDSHVPKGTIEFFASSFPPGSEGMIAGVMAHEIEHQKFQTVLDKYAADKNTLNGRIITTQAEAAQHAAAYQLDPYINRKAGELAASDGVTPYSTAMWQAAKEGKVPTLLAIHETLAEMARLQNETGSPARMAPSHQVWRNLYTTVNTLYEAGK